MPLTFPMKFISQEEYDKLSDESKAFYKIKDDTIKNWSKLSEVINAFTWTIFDHYENITPIPPYSVSKISSELKNENINTNDICKIFEFTGNKSDYITVTDLTNIIKTKNISKCQLKNVIFKAKGVFEDVIKIDGKSKRVWRCIKENSMDDDDVDDSDDMYD